MKISRLQIAGIAVVVTVALAIIVLQLTGHGMMNMIDHPPTPPDLAARGIKLDHRLTVMTPLSFIVLKWVAVVGVVCIVIPFISRREKTSHPPNGLI